MNSRIVLGGVFVVMLTVLGAALLTRPVPIATGPQNPYVQMADAAFNAIVSGSASPKATTPAAKTPPKTAPATGGQGTQTSASGGYSMAQVAKHGSASSCWSAINGNVYDLTSWINQHPGGPGVILMLCGTDGSAAFNGQHGGQGRPASELAGFLLGPLSQ